MKQRILNHLIQFGSITSWEAIMDYGCTRLSEYIRQIREDIDIDDEWINFTNRFNEKIKIQKIFY